MIEKNAFVRLIPNENQRRMNIEYRKLRNPHPE